MSPFAQSLCQTQISILEIFNIFLRLKFSPSSTLAKIEHFSKVSPTLSRFCKGLLFPAGTNALVCYVSSEYNLTEISY
jgi:hypothetical protein